ncbi:serine/threonine-protein phosphatase 7 long form homolog [Glycine soja]|uniref:serine/threonine-protein phosphatase 7 long form homolog n=1 Tax=Glycine soja TaxID=3848 RepID=UPI00103AFCB3|nr:serine/threonine-protein phosphatase 7 long form homolog [Glycine soja]
MGGLGGKVSYEGEVGGLGGSVRLEGSDFIACPLCFLSQFDLTQLCKVLGDKRPETHTFHFPWGECTITLEDVALHLGIRVDGRVVTRPSFLHWDELCHELLGKVPPENARKGAALKLTWLLSMLRASLPEEPIMHQLQCRWSGGRLEYRATPHGDLVRYRSRIDHMESHEFSWVPYKGFEEHLPRCAYRDMEIWFACIAIICFSIVEWHQTNRVKLQFGLQQDIPVDPMNLDLLHKIYMRGNHYIDWIEYHAEWINIWKNKRSDVLAG